MSLHLAYRKVNRKKKVIEYISGDYTTIYKFTKKYKKLQLHIVTFHLVDHVSELQSLFKQVYGGKFLQIIPNSYIPTNTAYLLPNNVSGDLYTVPVKLNITDEEDK